MLHLSRVRTENMEKIIIVIARGCELLSFTDQELQAVQAWMMNGIYPPELMCHNWNECCWESNKCSVFWRPSPYDRWDPGFFARPCNPSQCYTHIIASTHQVHPSASAHIHVWKTNDQWDDQKGWEQAKSYLGIKLGVKVSTQETGEKCMDNCDEYLKYTILI